MAHGLSRMIRMFQLYAISYQPYAKYARLASEIFLSNLQAKSSDVLNRLNVWNSLNFRELGSKLSSSSRLSIRCRA
jgi:hypothetical protein